MYVCVDGWMDGQMDGWVHACMDNVLHVCMFGCMCVYTLVNKRSDKNPRITIGFPRLVCVCMCVCAKWRYPRKKMDSYVSSVRLLINLCYTCDGEQHDGQVSGLPSMLEP